MIKKLLPLFLFVLISFFYVQNGNAADKKCPDETGTLTVVCGANSPDANGTILWSNTNKSLQDLSVIQAILNVRNKSRILFKSDSTISFDANGCESDTCGSKNPYDRDYNINTLEVDNSEFFQGNGSNPLVYMKDENKLTITNNSTVTLGHIKEKETGGISQNGALVCTSSKDGCYTSLDISVRDADLAIGSIIFENPFSRIRAIRVNNENSERGKYRVTFGGDIKVSSVEVVSLKNADVIIGGDFIAYGVSNNPSETMTGKINSINLDYSDLVLRGDTMGQASSILVRRESVFKVDPRSGGEHTLVLGGGDSVINVDGKSKFIAHNIKMNVPTVTFIASDEGTTINVNKVYFADSVYGFGKLTIDATVKSSVDFGIIDSRENCLSGNCGNNSAQTIELRGDKLSSFKIGKIFIDNDATILDIINVYGSIDEINYSNSFARIFSSKTAEKSLHIGSINFLYDAPEINGKVNYYVGLRGLNSKIDNFNFKKSDYLEFDTYDSNIQTNNIVCSEYCNNITFMGNEVTPVKEREIFNFSINNFNAGSSNQEKASNSFKDISLKVSGRYDSNGIFAAENSKLEFGSLNGTYESINLKSSNLTIEKNSDMILNSGKIDIDSGSTFTVKGNIFKNPDSVNIINNGTLNILVGNNFHSLRNEKNAMTKLDGGSHIILIDNLGTLKLHKGATIDRLNNESIIEIYGENRIESYNSNTENSELKFIINDRKSSPTLTIHKMENETYLGKMSISFKGTNVLKPGLSNRYNLIKTEKGSIGIDHDEYSKMLNFTPPWLVHDENIDFNNSENADEGETAWVNIQRLTDYSTLVQSVPGYGSDSSIVSIAKTIDAIIFKQEATEELQDIVNSLDLNSGCGYNEELIYKVHQGKEIIDIASSPCLYQLAESINRLKPVSNEVYSLYSHNNVIKSLDILLDANKVYVYNNEIYSWYKVDVGYSSLANKGYDTGFSSVSSMIYAGATIAPFNSYNFSGLVGFGIGNLNGNKNLFDGNTNTIVAGLAGSYLHNTYYISVSSLFGIANFKTSRKTEFLDNAYSDNKEIGSLASLSVLEVAIKAEAGNEYLLSSTTFLIPKIFISQAVLNNSGYEEFGSSAALNVKSHTMFMTDVGVGLEIHRELLLPSFLGIDKAFWYPKFGVNLVERFYQTPNTKMKFTGTDDNFYINIVSAGYSGILTQFYGSLAYQNNALEMELGYNGDYSISGYTNHYISATLKYSFQ